MMRRNTCNFLIRVLVYSFLVLVLVHLRTICNAEITSKSVPNSTSSVTLPQKNSKKNSTNTKTSIIGFPTLLEIILGTAFGILAVSSVCLFFVVRMSRNLMHQQIENTEAMNHCAKVISIEKPSVTDEDSENIMQMPVVKLKYEPCPDADNLVEFKMQPDKNWEFSRKNLRLEKVIGEGAFGTVVKGEADGIVEKNVTTTVAIKMLKALHYDTDMINLVIEMEVMKMIGKHPNILNLLGCCTQGGPLLVILEYVARGNLRDFLKQNNPIFGYTAVKLLTEKTLISFALQIAKGMEYLASRKYVHRDIAARNVLVSEDYVLKIADFGLARDIHNNDYYKKTTEGALPFKWMAPEALCLSIFTTKTDVWSFGVILWEIQTLGDTPYPMIPVDSNLFSLLHKGYRMEKPTCCPAEIYSIMQNCWKYEPDDRPSFSDLVETLEKILTKTKDETCQDIKRCINNVDSSHLDTPPWSQESVV